MPKMMYRKDIEVRLKTYETQLEKLKEEPESTITIIKRNYLTGYTEALKDVLG